MSATLRPSTARAIFAAYRRLQPVYLSRALCKVPPEGFEKTGAIEAADKTKQTEEKAPADKSHDAPQENVSTTESPEAVHEKVQKSPGEPSLGTEDKVASKREATHKKLHDLLTSLATAEPIPVESSVQLSRPKFRQRKQTRAVKEESAPATPPEPALEPELVSATREVAESLGGDVETTESELLTTLRLHSPEAGHTAPSLSELFVGMKVERQQPKQAVKEEQSLRRYDADVTRPRRSPPRDSSRPFRPRPRTPGPSAPRTPVDLFGAEPLGIFSSEPEQKATQAAPSPTSMLPVWERIHLHELELSVSHPPTNAIVEMIQWTNEGKLWTFPIDNEIGLEEEKKIGFHEHIFLERHLEGWCPLRGPIRHFMELVCTGLSKNPYLTVERKRAHIEWYKNYFAQKEELLREIGAIEAAQ